MEGRSVMLQASTLQSAPQGTRLGIRQYGCSLDGQNWHSAPVLRHQRLGKHPPHQPVPPKPEWHHGGPRAGQRWREAAVVLCRLSRLRGELAVMGIPVGHGELACGQRAQTLPTHSAGCSHCPLCCLPLSPLPCSRENPSSRGR